MKLNFCNPIRSDIFLRILFTGFVLLGIHPAGIIAQVGFEQTAPSKYRVVFTDKQNSPYTTDAPEQFLSQRSIERRQKQNIIIKNNDLPVSAMYIDSVRNSGARILTVSKWFNSVTVEVHDSTVLNRIATWPFVDKKTKISQLHRKSAADQASQSFQTVSTYNYGPSWWQTAVLNGQVLHNNGYTGNAMVIAVIDAGFYHADTLPAFNRLYEHGQILGTRDFVEPGNNVYTQSSHGMSVLSIIGGNLPGQLVGTAPDASFWLLRSENASSEYIIEEDNWIAAAEFADSVGADIINSSLGYTVFNDSVQNHTYADMDGNTTRVSIGADIAASKGILVVVSAGNQGNGLWKYISAPADADSALTIGAIDPSGSLAEFSSRGPSSDGRVKPSVVAPGQGVYNQGIDGTIRQGSGTSFASPVITGLSACLWQANPGANAMDVYRAIVESADRFYNPDSDYGYGIPDFNLADVLLKASTGENKNHEPVMAFPNPFSNQLYLFFETPVSVTVNVRLFDLAGKEIFKKAYPAVDSRKYLVIDNDLDWLQKGVYIMRTEAGSLSGNIKVVKY
ncbi:MAG TPA: S8 family serine peptidase [Bacteroidales bacterium]|nr:S8 family serine peptidase [Bacteroidales bacterium]